MSKYFYIDHPTEDLLNKRSVQAKCSRGMDQLVSASIENADSAISKCASN